MILLDVLFLMVFSALWGGVVGWNIGADRDKPTLPAKSSRPLTPALSTKAGEEGRPL